MDLHKWAGPLPTLAPLTNQVSPSASRPGIRQKNIAKKDCVKNAAKDSYNYYMEWGWLHAPKTLAAFAFFVSSRPSNTLNLNADARRAWELWSKRCDSASPALKCFNQSLEGQSCGKSVSANSDSFAETGKSSSLNIRDVPVNFRNVSIRCAQICGFAKTKQS